MNLRYLLFMSRATYYSITVTWKRSNNWHRKHKLQNWRWRHFLSTTDI